MQKSNWRILQLNGQEKINMDTVFTLLNINADILRNFPIQANLVEDKGTERILHQNSKRLKQIEQAHDSDVDCKMTKHSIDAVIQKVLRNAVNGSDEELNLPELRIISYNLSQLHGEDKAYFYAIDLLDIEWQDMFFNGLVSYLLSSWNRIREDYLTKSSGLFTTRLQAYSGRIQRYLKLKENIDFFKEGGPMRLGALVARKGMDLKDAPAIFGYKHSAFAHSYFSDVIIKYIKDANITDIDFFEDEIFEYHKEDRTKKLVFASLVMAAEKAGDSLRQTRVSAVARRVLGDITLASTWAPFQGATDEDIYKLKRASELVNLWLNRRVIEAFFEVCVQDKTRERFWIKYAKEVTGFKIAGSTMVKRSLQQDPRIDFQTLNRCFVETNSSISRTSALILVFRGKAIVEFSDVGSVYAYDVTNRVIAPVLKGKRQIEKTDELKETSLPILVENQGYYSWLQEQGRLTHRGEWESRLRLWLNEKVFVSSNVAPNLFSSSDIFRAKPISYEKPKIEDFPKDKDAGRTKNPEVVQHSLFDEPGAVNQSPSPKGCTLKSSTSSANAPSFDRNNTTNSQKPPTKKKDSIWTTLDSPSLGASKWVFDDMCQIVCTKSGFYLHIATKQVNIYAKIKEYTISSIARGSIWIKRPRTNGWCPVVYAVDNKEELVGLIKSKGERVLYRISDDHPECKSYSIK